MRNNSLEEKRVFSVVMEKRLADRIDRMSFRENRSRSGIINEIVEKHFLAFEEKRVFSVVLEKRFADRIDRMSFRENRSRSGIINEIVEKHFLALDGREMETSDEGGQES